MKCSKCEGQLEKIQRAGVDVFYHCRACMLPHDEGGNPLFTSRTLADRYNPLQAAREAIKKAHPGKVMAKVTRTALEVALLQTTQEAYFAGIKDGVLLAFSQDFEEGEPMEKLGVSNEDLKKELQERFNDLKAVVKSEPLSKTASAAESEMDAIKARLDELEDSN